MALFYREQAHREQSAADGAALENVRERSQRAADAWAKLADRIDRSDEMRAAGKRDQAPG